MSSKSKYQVRGLAETKAGLKVYVVRETGGVPRFEWIVVPWALLIVPEVMRPLVERHTRSMDAPPPWNEGDVTDALC